MPITLSGRDVDRGDLVDVERRRVRRQQRARLADLVELAEDRLLQLHVLEHGLDDDVARGEVGLVGRPGDQRHPLLDRLGRDRTARRGPLVVLADHGEALVERLLVAFDDRHRDADVGEVHGDAATHRPRAEHAARLDVEDRRVLGDVGDLVGGALGEERVALGGRLRPGDELDEQLLLDLQALVERQVGGGLDALDVVLGGEEAA